MMYQNYYNWLTVDNKPCKFNCRSNVPQSTSIGQEFNFIRTSYIDGLIHGRRKHLETEFLAEIYCVVVKSIKWRYKSCKLHIKQCLKKCFALFYSQRLTCVVQPLKLGITTPY